MKRYLSTILGIIAIIAAFSVITFPVTVVMLSRDQIWHGNYSVAPVDSYTVNDINDTDRAIIKKTYALYKVIVFDSLHSYHCEECLLNFRTRLLPILADVNTWGVPKDSYVRMFCPRCGDGMTPRYEDFTFEMRIALRLAVPVLSGEVQAELRKEKP